MHVSAALCFAGHSSMLSQGLCQGTLLLMPHASYPVCSAGDGHHSYNGFKP